MASLKVLCPEEGRVWSVHVCSVQHRAQQGGLAPLRKLHSRKAHEKVVALKGTVTRSVWGLEQMVGRGEPGLELKRLNALGTTAPGATLGSSVGRGPGLVNSWKMVRAAFEGGKLPSTGGEPSLGLESGRKKPSLGFPSLSLASGCVPRLGEGISLLNNA